MPRVVVDSPKAPTSLLTEEQRAFLDAALAVKAEGETP